MSDIIRLIATGFIWGMVALMVTLAGPASDDMTALVLFLSAGATLSTAAIWLSAAFRPRGEMAQAAKAKRDSRLSRLVDELDQDEVYQLEDLLEARRDTTR
jgi:hypothetical protein